MISDARLRELGFTRHCDCPDPYRDSYGPCENCGRSVAWHVNGNWVEAPAKRGCRVDQTSHCLSWAQHTQRQCRSARSASGRRVLSPEYTGDPR